MFGASRSRPVGQLIVSTMRPAPRRPAANCLRPAPSAWTWAGKGPTVTVTAPKPASMAALATSSGVRSHCRLPDEIAIGDLNSAGLLPGCANAPRGMAATISELATLPTTSRLSIPCIRVSCCYARRIIVRYPHDSAQAQRSVIQGLRAVQ
jgi:hypothetical protein